jgi:hypothetical protein
MATPNEEQKEPSKTDLQSIASNASSPESKLREAATQAEAALSSYNTASSLRTAAATIRDPAKRAQYLRDAYAKEVEAHGNSKKARMLQSGAFQGAVGGGGIGAVVAGGLGTVVGTLVGTVTAIPATAVGGLVGAGVGLGHGGWIKLGKPGEGKDGKGEKKEGEEGEGEGKEKEGEEGEEEIDVENAVPNPELLRKAAEDIERERQNGTLDAEAGAEEQGETKEKQERRKPRKLNRAQSGQGDLPEQKEMQEEKKEKKKPRKIEVRSG